MGQQNIHRKRYIILTGIKVDSQQSKSILNLLNPFEFSHVNDVQKHTASCILYFWVNIVTTSWILCINQGSVDRGHQSEVLFDRSMSYQYLNEYCFNEHFMIWPLDLKTKCPHQKLIKSAYSNLSNDHLWPFWFQPTRLNLSDRPNQSFNQTQLHLDLYPYLKLVRNDLPRRDPKLTTEDIRSKLLTCLYITYR